MSQKVLEKENKHKLANPSPAKERQSVSTRSKQFTDRKPDVNKEIEDLKQKNLKLTDELDYLQSYSIKQQKMLLGMVERLVHTVSLISDS